jgi:micrococcal nuclease
MKKPTSALLSLSLLGLPLVASAQPVIAPSDHSVLVAATKNPVKKAIKKAAKSSTKSAKSAAASSAKSKAAIAPSASCAIKGNISATKEKIFHVLGCPNYGQTVIDTTKGERMFCSEQEAKDAGWRKALNCP